MWLKGAKGVLFFVVALVWTSAGVIAKPVVQACPTSCKCDLGEDGLYTASCIQVSAKNKTAPYHNIHALKIKARSANEECFLPKDIPTIFPELNSLHLDNCFMSYIPLGYFRNLTKLEEVDLSNNSLKKISPYSFVSNSKLRYISLRNNELRSLPDKPFLISNSIWEIDLSSCGLSEIPDSMFKGLPNLRYLTLNDNKISTIYPNTLPHGLRVLSLARNQIANVPTVEFLSIRMLKEIDLSGNPINCTCQLVGFQNWISGKGVVFLNDIICFSPKEYFGKNLVNIPQYELCEATLSSESESADNSILPALDGYQADQPAAKSESSEDTIELYEHDEVFPAKQPHKRSSTEDELEGSGDEDVAETTEAVLPAKEDHVSTPVSHNDEVSSAVTPETEKQVASETAELPQTRQASIPDNSRAAENENSSVSESKPVTENTNSSNAEANSEPIQVSSSPASSSDSAPTETLQNSNPSEAVVTDPPNVAVENSEVPVSPKLEEGIAPSASLENAATEAKVQNSPPESEAEEISSSDENTSKAANDLLGEKAMDKETEKTNVLEETAVAEDSKKPSESAAEDSNPVKVMIPTGSEASAVNQSSEATSEATHKPRGSEEQTVIESTVLPEEGKPPLKTEPKPISEADESQQEPAVTTVRVADMNQTPKPVHESGSETSVKELGNESRNDSISVVAETEKAVESHEASSEVTRGGESESHEAKNPDESDALNSTISKGIEVESSSDKNASQAGSATENPEITEDTTISEPDQSPKVQLSNSTDTVSTHNGTAHNATGALLSMDSGSDKTMEMSIYGLNVNVIVPIAVVVIFLILCLVVYVAQRNRSRKNWSPDDARNEQRENEGTELQEVSLLSSRPKATIMKNNNTKYPEEDSEQTERLMPDQLEGSKEPWNGAKSGPGNETIPEEKEEEDIPNIDDDDEVVPNGGAASMEGAKENGIEKAKAKVTMLPDSVPMKPVFIDRNSVHSK